VAANSGVFLLQGDDTLMAMEPGEFVSENDFQKLLSRFPELLVGDQIDPEDPRRWVLVKREQSISTGEIGASSWSIDHVFLDQDGIPTLVEIKRKSDSRLRREVVGQMLDYASNCITYWSAESLKSSFEATCNSDGKPSEAVLRGLIGEDQTAEHFWNQVDTNLKARKLRLLFVADMIPMELRRVVEFLNDQMNETEVLAVELRQFVSGSLRTIVPTVIGHSQIKSGKRSGNTRQWDEASLFEKLSQTVGDAEVKLARDIYEWMRNDGKRLLNFGTGKDNGSVYPLFKPSGIAINPLYLSSDGKVWLQFGALTNKPVFGDVRRRTALMQKLNAIEGVNLTDADLAKYRSIPLKVVTSDPHGAAKLLDALIWMQHEIQDAE
jgi:hypothetical protein